MAAEVRINPIGALQALQEAKGYLSQEDLRGLSERLRIPRYDLEGISSFYPEFRRSSPPALRVSACRDLSCHLRDGGRSLKELASLCAGRDDVAFEAISCPGLCDRALHYREAAANVLTNDKLDPDGKIPEFKFCAVQLEAADL